MCRPDERFFSSAQSCYAILEPSACDAFRACEQTVLHRCVLCVGVLSAPPVDFLEFFPGNRNHHHFSDDVGYELQLVCHCEAGHCEVEDEDAACGLPHWLSAVPPSSFSIDIHQVPESGSGNTVHA